MISCLTSGYYPGGSSSATLEPNPTMVSEQFCLLDGCYTFTVFDSYGDGLNGSQWSCNFDGNYQIYDANGTVLASLQNVNFGTSEATNQI